MPDESDIRKAFIHIRYISVEILITKVPNAMCEKQRNPLDSRPQSRAPPIVYPASKATAEAEHFKA